VLRRAALGQERHNLRLTFASGPCGRVSGRLRPRAAGRPGCAAVRAALEPRIGRQQDQVARRPQAGEDCQRRMQRLAGRGPHAAPVAPTVCRMVELAERAGAGQRVDVPRATRHDAPRGQRRPAEAVARQSRVDAFPIAVCTLGGDIAPQARRSLSIEHVLTFAARDGEIQHRLPAQPQRAPACPVVARGQRPHQERGHEEQADGKQRDEIARVRQARRLQPPSCGLQRGESRDTRQHQITLEGALPPVRSRNRRSRTRPPARARLRSGSG